MPSTRVHAIRSLALLLSMIVVGCMPESDTASANEQPAQETAQEGETATFSLTSPAFVESGIIPERFTGDGENVSPPLEWRGAPAGTRGFALALVDPDVPWGEEVPEYGEMPPPGTQPADLFIHWMVVDLPADLTSLAAGASPGSMPEGAREMTSSFTLFGGPGNQYGGPAPPPGTKAHEYRFILYALDVPTLEGLSADSDYAAFTEEMAGHVIAATTLTGYYGR